MRKKILTKTISGIALLLSAGPSFAHHPMGGATPATFMEGLLSGIGHPLIGFDHLAFILVAGLLIASMRLPVATGLAFVAGSSLGVLLCVAGSPVPMAETAVALSVLLAGALLASGRSINGLALGAGFALFGVFHGYAFGEAVVGAERTPIAAYLFGLALIQFGIIFTVTLVLRLLGDAAARGLARGAGVAASLAGVVFLAT
ncbi:MAG: HupE/UreJ family protein [Beijerinckiaceae bacterium]|nr:HupE/UreJ family protein [Beijerinckiaceae bacterium]